MSIQTLPAEILGEIFGYEDKVSRASTKRGDKSEQWSILDKKIGQSSITLQKIPMYLALRSSQVCGRWRTITRGISSLWLLKFTAQISVSDADQLSVDLGDFTREIGSLKSSRLEITLNESPRPPYEDLLASPSPPLEAVAVSVASIAVAFKQRLYVLDVLIRTEVRMNIFQIMLSGVNLERLHRMSIKLPPTIVPFRDPAPDGGTAQTPALRELTASFVLPHPIGTFKSVTSLTVQLYSRKTWLKWQTTLVEFVHLKNFELDMRIFAGAYEILETQTPTKLPALTSLKIFTKPAALAWHSFVSLSTPNLEKFSLVGDMDPHATWPNVTEQFEEIQLPALTEIDLQPVSYMAVSFLSIAELPSLETITVSHKSPHVGGDIHDLDQLRLLLRNRNSHPKLDLVTLRNTPHNLTEFFIQRLVCDEFPKSALDVDKATMDLIHSLTGPEEECHLLGDAGAELALGSLQYLSISDHQASLACKEAYPFLKSLRTLRVRTTGLTLIDLMKCLPNVPSETGAKFGDLPKLEAIQVVSSNWATDTLDANGGKKYVVYWMFNVVPLVDWLARCWRTRPLQIITFSYSRLARDAKERLAECVPEIYDYLNFVPPFEMQGIDTENRHLYLQ